MWHGPDLVGRVVCVRVCESGAFVCVWCAACAHGNVPEGLVLVVPRRLGAAGSGGDQGEAKVLPWVVLGTHARMGTRHSRGRGGWWQGRVSWCGLSAVQGMARARVHLAV
jgi:hypothetical protein